MAEIVSIPNLPLDAFAQIILRCWSRDTSRLPQLWREDQPSIGQSLQTALLVQESMGGYVIGGHIDNWLHYWNVLPIGIEVDFCREHFGASYVLYRSSHFIERENIQNQDDFLPTYNLLRTRFLAHIHFENCSEVKA
jgi:hypothetical protein